MDTAALEQKIRSFALDRGAAAVGIADAEEVARYAPAGHRPADLLRGAKSVVVVAGGQPSAGAWRAGRARVLGSIGYNRSVAGNVAHQLTGFIEREFGHYAMLCPSSLEAGHYPYASLKLLGEMAGLGTRSLAAGIILHPEFGLLYYAATLTTLALTADGPLADSVCPHPSCWRAWQKRGSTPCLDACPTCLAGELSEGAIAWMEYRQDLCFPRAQTTAMDILQKMLVEAMDQDDSDRRKAIVFGSHFTRALRSVAYGTEISAQCFECLRHCPVGGGRRRLK
jgi:hypothetical protein